MLLNSWTYEEAEEALLASYQGRNAEEISTQMDRVRSTGAVTSFLNNFWTWRKLNGDAAYISKIMQNHFARYVQEHPDEIPVRPSSAEYEIEVEEVDGANEAGEETIETDSEETDSDTAIDEGKSWDAVKKAFNVLGEAITTHIQAKIDEGSEAGNTQIAKLEKENKQLRERIKKVQKSAQELLSL